MIRYADGLSDRATPSITTLISVSTHYNDLLSSSASARRSKTLSPSQVSQVIKQGYDTLSITAKDGLDSWDKYREADEKTTMKKIARVAVADVKELMRTR